MFGEMTCCALIIIKIADPESYGVKNPLTRSVIAGLTIGF